MTAAEFRALGETRFPELAALQPSPFPSPLECWKLSANWPLDELWVKRDDLLGPPGTKLRKLTVELTRARASGRPLVTVGYLNSNHALCVAKLAAVPVTLELIGSERDNPARVEQLRALAPTHLHATTLGLIAGTAWQVARRLGRATFLPPGGTTAASTAAVALAVAEVVEQFGAAPLPTRWAIAVGSGGALAGLCAGVKALGLAVRPLGVATSSRWVGPRHVAALANRALAFLGLSERVAPSEIEIDWSAFGGGHGKSTVETIALGEALAREGRLLDPNYTAKAITAVRNHARRGERWLFWHTGLSAQ